MTYLAKRARTVAIILCTVALMLAILAYSLRNTNSSFMAESSSVSIDLSKIDRQNPPQPDTSESPDLQASDNFPVDRSENAISIEPNLVEEIELRQPAPLSERGLPDSLARELEQLEAEASAGNVGSAFILYRSLSSCQNNRFQQDTDLEAAIDEMQRTNSIVTRGNGQEFLRYVDPAKEEPRLRKLYEFCSGVPDEKTQSADKWLELAADLGNRDSQMQIGRENYDNETGQNYLQLAWLQGNLDALGWLANGYLDSEDNLTAFAYQIAYAQLSAKDYAVRGSSESPTAQRWIDADKQGLLKMGSGLSDSDRQQAYEIARSLIASNPNCCMRRQN